MLDAKFVTEEEDSLRYNIRITLVFHPTLLIHDPYMLFPSMQPLPSISPLYYDMQFLGMSLLEDTVLLEDTDLLVK